MCRSRSPTVTIIWKPGFTMFLEEVCTERCEERYIPILHRVKTFLSDLGKLYLQITKDLSFFYPGSTLSDVLPGPG